jgi:integration host factor subunit alpha
MTHNSNILLHEEPSTMTLTKIQIVESIHNQIGLPKNKSTEIVETLLEIIKSSLASGEDVRIPNFGKFCVKEKKERRGRNPATGDDLMLEPRKVVTFKCSGKLRDRVNGQ